MDGPWENQSYSEALAPNTPIRGFSFEFSFSSGENIFKEYCEIDSRSFVRWLPLYETNPN